MKIKFTKTHELNGDVIYRIYADDKHIKSFVENPSYDAKNEAKKFYDDCIKFAKENYPITETLAEETIDIAPKP